MKPTLEDLGEVPYLPEMATTVERLAQQAMKLPTEARARLADLLVESLDAQDIGRIEKLWAAEAVRRRDEVRSGSVTPIPGGDAQRRVRRILGR